MLTLVTYNMLQFALNGDEKMSCDFDYCIYNQGLQCVLENIQINSLGMCDACMIITIDKDYLEENKEKQLQDITERYK